MRRGLVSMTQLWSREIDSGIRIVLSFKVDLGSLCFADIAGLGGVPSPARFFDSEHEKSPEILELMHCTEVDADAALLARWSTAKLLLRPHAVCCLSDYTDKASTCNSTLLVDSCCCSLDGKPLQFRVWA